MRDTPRMFSPLQKASPQAPNEMEHKKRDTENQAVTLCQHKASLILHHLYNHSDYAKSMLGFQQEDTRELNKRAQLCSQRFLATAHYFWRSCSTFRVSAQTLRSSHRRIDSSVEQELFNALLAQRILSLIAPIAEFIASVLLTVLFIKGSLQVFCC